MITQFKKAVLTAVVLGAAVSMASPAFAAEGAKKHVSCTTEAKHAGMKGSKEIHKYVKECKQKRAMAKKHAKEMKK